jgi:hypothetical protein
MTQTIELLTDGAPQPKAPYLLLDNLVPLIFAGLVAWPFAFAAAIIGSDIVDGAPTRAGDTLTALAIAGGVSLVTILLPTVGYLVLRKAMTARQKVQSRQTLWYVVGASVLLAAIMGGLFFSYGVVLLLVALIPVTIASIVLGYGAFKALNALRAHSLWAFALVGGVMGLLPAGAMILFQALVSRASDPLLNFATYVTCFWVVGSMIAASVVWLWHRVAESNWLAGEGA